MKRIATTVLLLFLSLVPAASEQDDRGYLQAFLEDNLSDAGRNVRIIGFEGALSSRATIQELTIADDDGVWLTLRGAVLDWNRRALLRGQLEIEELSAREILLPRMPNSVLPEDSDAPVVTLPELPAAEAREFSLPELPISINIGTLRIARVVLGQAVFGEAATISLDGTASIENGAGQAQLSVRRIDEGTGEMTFDASFANETRALALSFRLTEAAGGIVANLLNLPDRPSVDLQVAGDGTLEDFAAEISLKTGGEDNLNGQVILGAPPDAEAGTRVFSFDLSGDMRPLVQPKYREFLGPDVRFAASGQRTGNAELQIDEMTLTTQEARIVGELALGSDYWPRKFALDGRIAGVDDKEVLLSLPGIETRLRNAVLNVKYDAADSDEWTATLSVAELRRDDTAIDTIEITGGGRLTRGDGIAIGSMAGTIELLADGIASRNAELDQAIGPRLGGSVRFEWREDQPLKIPEFKLTGKDYSVSGDGTIQGLQDRLNVTAAGNFNLVADNLSRFSGVVGRPLTGAASLRIAGTGAPLSGAFDLRFDGTTRDIGLGIPQLDGLIGGRGKLGVTVRRDETGTRVEQLRLETPGADILASGDLKTGASTLKFDLRLPDASMVAPGLNGPAEFAGTIAQTNADWTVQANLAAPGAAEVSIDGRVTVDGNEIGPATGRADIRIGDFAPYSALAGRDLAGALQLTANGRADLQALTFSGSLTGTTVDVRTGISELDRLLVGTSKIAVEIRRESNGITVFDQLSIITPQVIADLTGSISTAKSRLRFNVDFMDIGLYAPELSGPVAAEGVIASSGGDWDVTASLRGPGGTAATVAGQIAADARRANLNIAGSAPLALANPYIAPNLASGAATFNLALDGPIALSSVSGTLRANDAGLVVPGQRIALGSVAASARLSGGRAQLDASAGVTSGGRMTLSGSLALSAPYPAELDIALSNVAVSEPGIYATTIDGNVSVRGPLAGGASIGGAFNLGPVEIRVPDTGGAAIGKLPGLEHENTPAAVRRTLARAGILTRDSTPSNSPEYPLDLIVNAPSRIFVRGRGLDAELGGQLRLTGTTADVITEGRFDLIRGRLDILGKRLTLTEGFAKLQGDFNPFLRIVAETQNGGATIRIVIEGIASEPEITVSSSPTLPEDEIVSRLLFGRDLSEISPLQALRIASAINTLTGGGRGDIISRLRQNFGLDDLDIATDETGATGVRVGKYISEKVYTDVTVDSTGKSEINLNLSITPSITARGTVGSDGSSGLGLFFEKDY